MTANTAESSMSENIEAVALDGKLSTFLLVIFTLSDSVVLALTRSKVERIQTSLK